MQVVGVVDLIRGQAVRARAGDRNMYLPVAQIAGLPIDPGSARALARAYIDDFGLSTLYLADLDAILGRRTQEELILQVAGTGATLWLDAGIRSTSSAQYALTLGASRVVVGLETLRSFAELEDICRDVDCDRLAFSLDLRGGRPIAASQSVVDRPEEIAKRAVEAGVRTLLVLDLDRVGTSRGLDLDMLTRVREAVPGTMLIAGGGIRGIDDLAAVAQCGCDGGLVATAILDGRLSASDVATVQHWPHRSGIR